MLGFSLVPELIIDYLGDTLEGVDCIHKQVCVGVGVGGSTHLSN